MSETDEAVGRVATYLDFYAAAVAGEYVESEYVDNAEVLNDLRTLLAALARVSEENKRLAREWDLQQAQIDAHVVRERVSAADLATLRERLAGEVGALREAAPSATHAIFDPAHELGWIRAIDRAVAVIRGEA